MKTNNPNWQDVVIKLLESHTQLELSNETGVEQSAISRIKNGKDNGGISYKSGSALLQAYDKAIKKDKRNAQL